MKKLPRPKLINPEFLHDDEISYISYQAHRGIKGLMQAAISFFIGTFVAAGGHNRWHGQSLEVAMGFPWAPVLLGVILIIGSTVLCGSVISSDPKLRWYGCWVCGLWHYTMMVFAFWKFLAAPSVVDDIAFFLWFFLATDYVMSALLSVKGANPVIQLSTER